MSVKLKILFVDYFSLKSGYGGELWIKEIASRLAKTHEVQVFTTDILVTKNANLSDFPSYLENIGVRVNECSSIPFTTFPSIQGFLKLFKLARWADVIYFHSIYGGMEFAIKISSTLFKVPVICGHHSPLLWYKLEPGLAWHKKTYFKIFGEGGKRTGVWFQFHHAINTQDYETLKKWPIKEAFYIPNGVETKISISKQKAPTFTLVFLGRFDRHKGADLLQELLVKLFKENLPIEFIIAGRGGPFEKKLNNVAIEFKFVKFLGYITDDEKNALLSRAHILVMPSRYEGFSMLSLESISMGTPILAFPVQGLTDLIKEGVNGYLVRNLEEMIGKIKDLYKNWNDGIYGNISKSTIESSLQYDWQVISEKLESMICSVVNGRTFITLKEENFNELKSN